MSAWSKVRGGPLSPPDVDAVIAFLHTWDPPTRAVLDERPLSGEPARGMVTFARECVSCHGARGIGGPNVNIGNRELLGGATNGVPATRFETAATELRCWPSRRSSEIQP